jgi:hypothetical protein
MAPTRREFLKTAGFSAVGMILPFLPSLASAQTGGQTAGGSSPTTPGPLPALKGKRWAMTVEPRKCRPGCADCIAACHLEHNVDRPRKSRTCLSRGDPSPASGIDLAASRPGSLQPLREPALRPGLSDAGNLQAAGRDRDDGLSPLHRLPLLYGRLPLRVSKHELPRSAALHRQDQSGLSDADQGGGGKMQLLRGEARPGAPSRLCHRLQGQGPGVRRFGRSPFGSPACA